MTNICEPICFLIAFRFLEKVSMRKPVQLKMIVSISSTFWKLRRVP